MKTDAITRAYSGLPHRERAALAFKYSCERNQLELTRISDTVPIVPTRGLHPEYLEHFDRLHVGAFVWAINHWQYYARMQTCRCEWLRCEAAGHQEATRLFQEATELLESRLMALDISLDEGGPEHGFDPEAVRKVAGCIRFEPIFIDAPDNEHVEEAMALLRQILTE